MNHTIQTVCGVLIEERSNEMVAVQRTHRTCISFRMYSREAGKPFPSLREIIEQIGSGIPEQDSDCYLIQPVESNEDNLRA